MSQTLLVRYGVVAEVARFRADDEAWAHRSRVVVRTHRGVELGTVLQVIKSGINGHDGETAETEQHVLRSVTADDDREHRQLQAECAAEFSTWQRRIADWNLELELIDLEWLLDRSKLVLYVLNDRGADCTKLAIYAAAEGLAPVEVQPVNANGLVQLEPAGGGCGSGGGGCGSCGTD